MNYRCSKCGLLFRWKDDFDNHLLYEDLSPLFVLLLIMPRMLVALLVGIGQSVTIFFYSLRVVATWGRYKGWAKKGISITSVYR